MADCRRRAKMSKSVPLVLTSNSMAPQAISSKQGLENLLKLCAPMGVLNGCNGSMWNGGSPAS
jgi:hypothetical protein